MHTTMATRTKSFPMPPLMLASIKRWADLAGTSDSEVIRVAVEIGLRSLQEDPSPLLGKDLGPPPGMRTSDPCAPTPRPPVARPLHAPSGSTAARQDEDRLGSKSSEEMAAELARESKRRRKGKP